MSIGSLDDLVAIAEFYPPGWKWKTETAEDGLQVVCEDVCGGVRVLIQGDERLAREIADLLEDLHELPRWLQEARSQETEGLAGRLAEANDEIGQLQDELDDLRASLAK